MEYNKWLSSKNVDKKDKEILKRMSAEEIEKSFGYELNFGTAGIRKHMGLGSSLLNKYVIKMIAFAWIKSLEKNKPEVLKKGLIIARDSRNNGKMFSEIVAEVISGMGYQAILFHENAINPTPIVSFAIKDLKLGGGACITASHNPPVFNGFKCFTSIGQHLMTRDSDPIAKELAKIDIDTIIPMSNKNIKFLDKNYEDYYLDSITKELSLNGNVPRSLKIVFSPQHGASYKLGPKILTNNNFKVYEVEKQSIPDGNFPHTPDPNPENPLAFNEMKKLGKKIGSELLLTTDPDSDRVAVGSLHNGEYYLFNGHEMSSMIVHYILSKREEIKNDDFLIKTVVTTTLIDKIAKKFGVNIVNTLTGFKYIGEVIKNAKKPPILATEESYGSALCPRISLDKDALQLLPVIAEMAEYYYAKNMTLVDALHSIYNEYEWYIHKNEKTGLTLKEFPKIKKIIEEFSKIKKIGNLKVKNISDFRNGFLDFEKTDLVIIHFEDDSWIAIRPSGTEPLIRKYYCIKDKNQDILNQKFAMIKKEFERIEKGVS